jgi:outer membrane protein insertion porin family
MLKGALFVDYGTVEREIEINTENFRVAPGFGLRISVPALGPAPLAFDFAFPVARAELDERRVFAFFFGVGR